MPTSNNKCLPQPLSFCDCPPVLGPVVRQVNMTPPVYLFLLRRRRRSSRHDITTENTTNLTKWAVEVKGKSLSSTTVVLVVGVVVVIKGPGNPPFPREQRLMPKSPNTS